MKKCVNEAFQIVYSRRQPGNTVFLHADTVKTADRNIFRNTVAVLHQVIARHNRHNIISADYGIYIIETLFPHLIHGLQGRITPEFTVINPLRVIRNAVSFQHLPVNRKTIV